MSEPEKEFIWYKIYIPSFCAGVQDSIQCSLLTGLWIGWAEFCGFKSPLFSFTECASYWFLSNRQTMTFNLERECKALHPLSCLVEKIKPALNESKCGQFLSACPLRDRVLRGPGSFIMPSFGCVLQENNQAQRKSRTQLASLELHIFFINGAIQLTWLLN